MTSPDAAPEQPLSAPPAEAGAPPGSAPTEAPPPPAAPRRRRRWPWILAVTILASALVAVAVYLYLVLQRLDDAVHRIEEQQEIIDTKETFSAAMHELVATAHGFDGTPFATIVPSERIAGFAARGWTHRWQPRLLEADIRAVRAATGELAATLEAAAAEAGSNATGSVMEGVLDELGRGFVTTLVDDADGVCETDVLGCVQGDDPYTVHFDAAEQAEPHLTDWIWTGVAYHEFAHVLQFTNPGPTETAAAAFGGDWETMADCFALTTLPGWSLEHRVYITSYLWWDVTVGYGHTCDESQRQVIRDWYDQVGYRSAPVGQ